ncbi:MAG TPA: NADH-quinone oxidoreductase subunit NuoG, partial [Dissulfurispiraceae bacterium]|nr:NADH-quinone oxidoreductase subunit NuoG [Dissulfurispiraceae bacterium]
MATIYIDSKPYEVRDGLNLLDACLSLGFDIPYFCWHPALGSVGACRQCAVKEYKDEHDTRGKIVMSCMTPAADGTRISIDDPEVRAFRAAVIEWLMVNHPHDCPVCDEGGECHLQDMTVMTGHTYRRFRFRKRTHRNQHLGPFINHEMNRCIQCYRCVQFYREFAGGRDFDVFAAHDHVYFGRHEEGTLESEFSGNLVEICPTGVFTDKTFKEHYTRKWDLQTAPSVCVHCGLGCNIIPGERYGTLRRIHNRYNGEVNRYFLCDRGRFGYGFVNSEVRIRTPLVRITGGSPGERGGGLMKPATADYALKRLSRLFYLGARVIGIGSPRASLEANFALRTLVDPGNFYLGMSEREHRMIAASTEVLTKGSARSPSLRDIELADTVFVLGEDVTNTAPMLDLALRRSVLQKPMSKARKLGIPEWQTISVRDAIQDDRGPLFIATPSGTKLDGIATRVYRAAPDELARLGFAISRILKAEAPDVASVSHTVETLAGEIARALEKSDRPVVVCGTSCGSEAVIYAAADVAWALRSAGIPAQLCVTVPECNSLGLGLMGGGSIVDFMHAVRDGRADTLIILENDLYRRVDEEALDLLFSTVKEIIVIDHLTNRTTARADIVLPAGTFAESSGTLVNNEGRGQRFFQVFRPDGEIRESWRWLLEMLRAAQRPEASTWRELDDITASMAESIPMFSPVRNCAPPAGFRIAGLKIPRQPRRYSGRTAMTAHLSVHEPSSP